MFQLGRDRSRRSSCRAVMPAIDRKCFDRKQTTSHGLAWCCVCMRVWKSMKLHWACTAFEHVETKTEKWFREEVDFLASLAFVVVN